MIKKINEVRVLNTSTETEFRTTYEHISNGYYELITKRYDLSNVPSAVIKFIQNPKVSKVESISSACTLYHR